jgi:hypothetical protein
VAIIKNGIRRHFAAIGPESGLSSASPWRDARFGAIVGARRSQSIEPARPRTAAGTPSEGAAMLTRLCLPVLILCLGIAAEARAAGDPF